MHFPAWAIAPAARSTREQQCTSPIGAMHPATGTGTGIQVFAKLPLKWAITPLFSYESPPVHRCSQSPNSCTRPQRRGGHGKSRASKGVVRKTPLRRLISGDTRPPPATRGMGTHTGLAAAHRQTTTAPATPNRRITPKGAGPGTRHSRPNPPKLQYNRCNKPDTERQQTRCRDPPLEPRICPDSALAMASIAPCNAFCFSLQPTHCENVPGAVAVRPVALPLVLVNGDKRVLLTTAARVSPNPPRTLDVSRHARPNPPPERPYRLPPARPRQADKNAPFRSWHFSQGPLPQSWNPVLQPCLTPQAQSGGISLQNPSPGSPRTTTPTVKPFAPSRPMGCMTRQD